MKSSAPMVVLAGVGVAAFASWASAGRPLEVKTAEQHISAGRASSQPDFPGLAPLCGPPSRPLSTQMVNEQPWRMPEAIAPAKIFDNLVFLGNAFSTAWAVKTDAGIILIDTQSNEAEARRDIEGGLQSVGLNPADIRYIVISHGHGDHSGGARYLVQKYRPKLVISRIDWNTSRDPVRGIQAEGWNDIPTPDVLVDRQYVLKLGKTSITLLLTPGHTPGTLSTIIPVTSGSKKHWAVIWGGTGYNFGPIRAQYMAYATAAEAMRSRVLREKIDVFLSNHVNRDQTDKRIAQQQSASGKGSNPFVLTPQRVSKAFDVFRECALSQAARLDATTPTAK